MKFEIIEVYFVVPENKLAVFIVPVRTCPYDIKVPLSWIGMS